MSLIDTIKNSGLSLLGISVPFIHPQWTSSGTGQLTYSAGDLSLTLNTGNWVAPLNGIGYQLGTFEDSIEPTSVFVSLVKTDGNHIKESFVDAVLTDTLLLQLHEQAYLRLSRLYSVLLEAPDPDNSLVTDSRNQGLAIRPVPKYFYFSEGSFSVDHFGDIEAGDSIYEGGKMQIFDAGGHPIDPASVAEIFFILLNRFPILEAVDFGEAPSSNPAADYQLDDIAALRSNTNMMVRLSQPSGHPFTNSENRVLNLTGVDAGKGIFRVDPPNTENDLSISIAPVSADFPQDQRRLFLIGATTNGTLGDTFNFPPIPTGTAAGGGNITINRDFFSLQVIQLDKYLTGEPKFPEQEDLRLPPKIRTNESLTLLPDGNDVLGAITQSLQNTNESFVVAPSIEESFSMPNNFGDAAHWPQFPADGAGDTDDTPVPVSLREDLEISAVLFDDGNDQKANLDVILTIDNLPANTAIRVYNRQFLPDAVEGRGDGAGGIAPDSGTIALRLKDPFGIRTPGSDENVLAIPPSSVLSFDLIVVRRSDQKLARIFGNLSAIVDLDNPTTTDPTPVDSNPLTNAANKGDSTSAILGLPGNNFTLPALPNPTNTNALINFGINILNQFIDEGDPRGASRYPTMARRDQLSGGIDNRSGTPVFKATLSAGSLRADMVNADPRIGNPGGLGGKETQAIGVFTQNGPLAYDLMRAAFRRTTPIEERSSQLQNDELWAEPSGNTTNSGTMAGAVLQTISRFCETPEFAQLNLINDSQGDNLEDILSRRPDSLTNFPNWVSSDIGSTDAPLARNKLDNFFNSINGPLANLSSGASARLLEEINREIQVSLFGKRDAQWSLEAAIGNARHFIYIESPAFSDTAKDSEEPYAIDLIKKLKDRIDEVPGLRVIICTPRKPDYGKGYEPFIEYETYRRRKIIFEELPTKKVVAFHPVGFPGRQSFLENMLVIVDDTWALLGSSALRRRGLTFDGGTDLVFTDTQRIKGKSPAIAAFRRNIMAKRLGITQIESSGFGPLTHPDFVRLKDGVEAFYLIRETLRTGGLGKISRIFNAPKPDAITDEDAAEDPLIDLMNPEGEAFNLAEAVVSTLFSALNSY